MRIFFILILFLGQNSLSDAQFANKSIPVGVAEVVSLSTKQRIKLSGTVLPWTTSVLAAEIDGRVKEIFFNEGQYVKKGFLMVQLDTHPLELERLLAEAERKKVMFRLQELNAGSRREKIGASRAAMEKAEAQWQMSEIELKRTKTLFNEGIISVQDLDNKQALSEQALAQLNEKKAELDEALAGPRIEKIQQEEANLLTTDRRIRIIDDKIERTSIYAPFNGSVAKKETEIGQWLEKGDPALSMIVINPLKVEVHLPQYHFSEIELGTPAKVILQSKFPSIPNKTFDGMVIEKIYSGDPTSRTFPVRIKINQNQNNLAPGMLVRVQLSPKIESKKNYGLYVMKDAVVRTTKDTSVWVARLDKDKVMIVYKVLVETGEYVDNLIAVKPLNGKIELGDLVVVQGNERLRPNTKIEIIKRF